MVVQSRGACPRARMIAGLLGRAERCIMDGGSDISPLCDVVLTSTRGSPLGFANVINRKTMPQQADSSSERSGPSSTNSTLCWYEPLSGELG